MAKQLLEIFFVHRRNHLLMEKPLKKKSTFKEYKSHLNEIKRLPPDEFGKLLPEFCDEYGKTGFNNYEIIGI